MTPHPLLPPRVSDPTAVGTPGKHPRFLSEADCHDIARRLARYTQYREPCMVLIHSSWTGNVRWARNLVSTSGEVRRNFVDYIGCGQDWKNNESWEGRVTTNCITDAALVALVRQNERINKVDGTKFYPHLDLITHVPLEPLPAVLPQLFSEATYQLDAGHRDATATQLARTAADAGMLSAGYISVSANSLAFLTSWGVSQYYAYTWAQYSVTVRDPKGIGSGWAGVDWHDWDKIDGARLTGIALDKCLKSRNPVAVEPGRYTTILEPQAVCELVKPLMKALDRYNAEHDWQQPMHSANHEASVNENKLICYDDSLEPYSKIGERVVDERITISADPLDPELGFPSFNEDGTLEGEIIYRPVTWIERGVLQALSYKRSIAARCLDRSTGLGSDGAFRMSFSGVPTSMEEMVATTERGLLVTRFVGVVELERRSTLCSGCTRDGVWLIEKGKISKAVKNFRFVESILFALNNIEQLGVPQRAFTPPPKIFSHIQQFHNPWSCRRSRSKTSALPHS